MRIPSVSGTSFQFREGRKVLKQPDEWRHLVRSLRSLGRSTLEARTPWLPFRLISFLEAIDLNGSTIFEYGGGGSTAWFLDRGACVVTVDDSRQWFEMLNRSLGDNPKWEPVLREGAADREPYVREIDRFAENSFDIVVVDGRERVRCVKAAKSKVKPGGYLILDDVERERYAQAYEYMSDWGLRSFDGYAPGKYHVAHSAVWRRPECV